MAYFRGSVLANRIRPLIGIDFGLTGGKLGTNEELIMRNTAKLCSDLLTAASGESNYTGTGVVNGSFRSHTKASPILVTGLGAHSGYQVHLQQNVAMTAATNALIGFYATVNMGAVACTNGSLNGLEIYVRNASTGTNSGGYMRGGIFMIYTATGSQCKYKQGLLIDILDSASAHPSGGGTQGICLQLNPTSITNNQVDAILINQNSTLQIASGIVFKGKIGNVTGNHAVLNFVGSGDTAADGNKGNLFKFRSGSATYVVTPAQFLAALGANCTAI